MTGPAECAGSDFPARPPTKGKLWTEGEPPGPLLCPAAEARSSQSTTQRASPRSSRLQYCRSRNGRVSASMEEGEEGPSVKTLIKQPETCPISQEQLVAEVKGIYAGLVMVETKCLEIDNDQTISTPKANNEQWEALISLHRGLLEEHQDFLATGHISASPELRRLRSKYLHFLGQQSDIDDPFQYTGPIYSQDPTTIKPANKFEFSQDYYAEVGPQERNAVGRVPLGEPTWREAFNRPRDWLLERNNRCRRRQKDEEVLRWWLERIEELLDRIWKNHRLILIHLPAICLLLRLFVTFFFSEFPGGIRYLCTTMPWTIWPALVVLWGVCWMFIAWDELFQSDGFHTWDYQQDSSMNLTTAQNLDFTDQDLESAMVEFELQNTMAAAFPIEIPPGNGSLPMYPSPLLDPPPFPSGGHIQHHSPQPVVQSANPPRSTKTKK